MSKLQLNYFDLLQNLQDGRINKKQFLDELSNNFFGGSGLLVQVHNKDGVCTRWRDWQEVRDLDWWVANINHRNIASCELILDAESREEMAYCQYRLSQFGIIGKWIFTGSRGYHCHLFDNQILKFSTEQKRVMLSFLGVDTQKATNRTMISIELIPHWKTQQKGCLL